MRAAVAGLLWHGHCRNPFSIQPQRATEGCGRREAITDSRNMEPRAAQSGAPTGGYAGVLATAAGTRLSPL
jgi:hypothetical protein